jgi:hypothetical protein
MYRVTRNQSALGTKPRRKVNNQAGYGLIDVILALLLTLAIVVLYGRTTINAIKNENNILSRNTMHHLAVTKAQELVQPIVLERLAGNFIAAEQLGTVAPSTPLSGYTDEIDFKGQNVPVGKGAFIRQWTIINNKPLVGNQLIVVSIYPRNEVDEVFYFSLVRGERKLTGTVNLDE